MATSLSAYSMNVRPRQLFKQLISQSLCPIKMYHIYGHLGELLDCLDLLEIDKKKMNCKADGMAEEILLDGVSNQEFITSNFPFGDVRIHADGVKVAHNPRVAISNQWVDR